MLRNTLVRRIFFVMAAVAVDPANSATQELFAGYPGARIGGAYMQNFYLQRA